MKSLYVKFVVMTLGIMILSFFIAFVVSNAYYQYNLKASNDEKNTAIASEVGTFIETQPEMNIEEYLKTIADVSGRRQRQHSVFWSGVQ